MKYSFAPDPETTVDVTALRPLGNVRWHGPAHRAPWLRDPLGMLSVLLVGVGAVFVFLAIIALVCIGAYVAVT